MKNIEEYNKLINEFRKNEELSIDQKYKILDEMFKYSLFLGKISKENDLENIDGLIEFVKRIQSV